MTKLLNAPEVRESPVIAVTNAAALAKLGLLQVANAIKKIENESERDLAIRAAADIKGHIDAIEAARKTLKKPFWDMGVKIDSVAAAHVSELTTELRRINGFVGVYEEERRQAAARAEEELRRQQEQQQEQAAASPPPTDSGEALRRELEQEEQAVRAEEKIEQLKQTNDKEAPKGGAMRHDWDIAVYDIKALYASHPQCVELKARFQSIKDLLRTGITPAGVQAIKKTSYNVRGAAPKELNA